MRRFLEGLPRFPVAPFPSSPRNFAAAFLRHLPRGFSSFKKCLPGADLVEVSDTAVVLVEADNGCPFAWRKSSVALPRRETEFHNPMATAKLSVELGQRDEDEVRR